MKATDAERAAYRHDKRARKNVTAWPTSPSRNWWRRHPGAKFVPATDAETSTGDAR